MTQDANHTSGRPDLLGRKQAIEAGAAEWKDRLRAAERLLRKVTLSGLASAW